VKTRDNVILLQKNDKCCGTAYKYVYTLLMLWAQSYRLKHLIWLSSSVFIFTGFLCFHF